MAASTNIAWTKSTFNPWIGCSPVGKGCDNCYAVKLDARKLFGGSTHFGAKVPRMRTKPSNWDKVRQWNKAAPDTEFAGIKGFHPVFCASLGDVFDNEVDPTWRDDFWRLVKECPNLTFQVLTKRIGNAKKMLPADWGDGYPNVWLGATIVNQEEANRDVPKLLAVPAVKRFLSMEPLLGAVDLTHLNEGLEVNEINCLTPDTWDDEIAQWRGTEDGWEESFEDHYGVAPNGLTGAMHKSIDQVIVGGETGDAARPMHPQWVFNLRDQCKKAGIAFFFKQWGEWVPRSSCYHTFENGTCCSDIDPPALKWKCIRLSESGGDGRSLDVENSGDEAYMQKIGKEFSGYLLQGKEYREFP